MSPDNQILHTLVRFPSGSYLFAGLTKPSTVEGCNLSYTFKFWDTYVNDLSQLLLDYIAAKRDGIRDLELETFTEMLPYDFVQITLDGDHLMLQRVTFLNRISQSSMKLNSLR